MPRTSASASRLLDIAGGNFSAVTLQRGRNYAAEARVTIKSVREQPGEVHVEALVQGTLAEPYGVALWLNRDRQGEISDIEGVCMCPVEEDCKHVVAVLLTLDKLGSIPQRADRIMPPADADFTVPGTAAREWLSELGARVAPPVPDREAAVRVVYVLHPGDPPNLRVARSRPLKRGGYGKPTPYRPQPYDLVGSRTHRSLVTDADIAPLRLFLALQSSGGYFYSDAVDLVGETGSLLLRLALATGRLQLDGLIETSLQAGPQRESVWQWTHDAQGLQQLSLELPANFKVVATQPAYYLDPEHGLLGELKSTVPPGVVDQLLRAPPLNEADVLLVRQQLPRLLGEQAATLPLPQMPDAAPAGTPVLRLVLTRGGFRHHGGGRLQESMALVRPWFDYPGGVSVAAAQAAPPFLRQRMGDRWQTLQRDVETEARSWRLIHAAGLQSWRDRFDPQLVAEGEQEALLPRRNDVVGWLDFLNQGIPALEDEGVVIEFADDFPYTIAQAEDWFVAVEESVGSDWFDLDLGVRVGGERISLVAPLLRLLREEPDLAGMVRNLEDGQNFPVAIDERRILPVPAGRLKAWLLPLLEFLDDERPRLARHHAATLAGLDALPTQWIGGEELRRLGHRLRDFRGIEHRPPAPGFLATLRPYQQDGLDWLQFLREYGLAGILADDMGLGKTVQTLAHLQLEKASGRADRPSLVVATTSLMANWRNEAAQFTPDLKVLTLHGKDRAERFGEIPAADLVLTTYPLLVRDRETLLAQDWHLLVMDEAQFIKNPKAQSHQVARLLKSRHRLSLTGTPLENHLGELWAQFDYLMPGLLGNAKRFTQVYRTPIEKLGDEEMRTRLSERVRPFLLRRTKEQVLKDLPPRTEMVRWVEIEGGQRDLYESLRVAFDRKLRHALVEQGVGRSQIMIFDALLKLRQICCDPRLVRLPAAEALVRKGHAHSAKLATLMEMLVELLDEGRKVLLFSQFTSMLALIEAELEKLGIPFAKLTGQTRDRETPIADFQKGRVPLFLISLKAGGTGLNLTAADTVIHYDPWWNPAVEEQATARAHRIGQDKPVFVYKLMTQGTVEEKILALQDRKRGLADQLMRQGAGTATGGNLLTASDLDVLFEPLA
jgi:superfamily II DNA or RNA helicase